LARWKLFKKSNKKKPIDEKDIEIPLDEDTEETNQEEVVNFKPTEETNKTPITEYHETLYSSDHPASKGREPYKRRSWESASSIEKNVDDIDKKKSASRHIYTGSSEIEHKVDRLLSSKGMKTKGAKKSKVETIPKGYTVKVNKKTGLTYYKKD